MEGKMKAIVKEKEEPGFTYKEVNIPKIGKRDVLVNVKATAICGTDIHIYDWTPWAQARLKLPMVFGHEFSGEVVEVGSGVENIKVGDRIAGETHIPCGQCFQCQTGLEHICQNMAILGVHTEGSFAEYIAVPEACAWKIAKDMPFDQGAVLEPCGVAIHGLMAGNVGGNVIAIFGCGPIGLYAIAGAKAMGAIKIFAIDISKERLKLAEKMGATQVLNAQEVDVVKTIREQTTKLGGVDVVVEISGSPQAIRQGFEILRRSGTYVMVGLPSDPVTLELTSAIIYREAKVYGITGREMYATWWKMSSLIEAGMLDLSSVITHRFPLSEFGAAIQLAKTYTAGKIVLTPGK